MKAVRSLDASGFLDRQQERGATLLEVLITMLIVSFALLGIAGLQLASVRYQQTSHLRSTAITQVQIMAERIRTNANALSGSVDASAYRAANAYAAATTIPADPVCGLGSTSCTSAQSAQRDLREWRQVLAQELPGGRGSLFTVTSGLITSVGARTVTVMWTEKAQDSDDNLGSPPTDSNCPAPRVGGVKCVSVVVTP